MAVVIITGLFSYYQVNNTIPMQLFFIMDALGHCRLGFLLVAVGFPSQYNYSLHMNMRWSEFIRLRSKFTVLD